MEVTTMRAEVRAELGTNIVRNLRATGRVPGILYGRGKDPVNLSLDAHALGQELIKRRKVFQLDTGSGAEAVFLQDVQWDALTDVARHVDFKRIDLAEPIKLKLELTYIGVPEGLSKGGVLIRDNTTLAFRSMPTAIPHGVEVKIAKLGLGDALRAKDLELPEGVELDVSPETLICHITS